MLRRGFTKLRPMKFRPLPLTTFRTQILLQNLRQFSTGPQPGGNREGFGTPRTDATQPPDPTDKSGYYSDIFFKLSKMRGSDLHI